MCGVCVCVLKGGKACVGYFCFASLCAQMGVVGGRICQLARVWRNAFVAGQIRRFIPSALATYETFCSTTDRPIHVSVVMVLVHVLSVCLTGKITYVDMYVRLRLFCCCCRACLPPPQLFAMSHLSTSDAPSEISSRSRGCCRVIPYACFQTDPVLWHAISTCCYPGK